MVSRVNFLETEPGRIGDVARVVREVVYPGIREESGFVGYIVLGDRTTGKALGVTALGERGSEGDERRESSPDPSSPRTGNGRNDARRRNLRRPLLRRPLSSEPDQLAPLSASPPEPSSGRRVLRRCANKDGVYALVTAVVTAKRADPGKHFRDRAAALEAEEVRSLPRRRSRHRRSPLIAAVASRRSCRSGGSVRLSLVRRGEDVKGWPRSGGTHRDCSDAARAA